MSLLCLVPGASRASRSKESRGRRQVVGHRRPFGLRVFPLRRCEEIILPPFSLRASGLRGEGKSRAGTIPCKGSSRSRRSAGKRCKPDIAVEETVMSSALGSMKELSQAVNTPMKGPQSFTDTDPGDAKCLEFRLQQLLAGNVNSSGASYSSGPGDLRGVAFGPSSDEGLWSFFLTELDGQGLSKRRVSPLPGA